MIESGTVRFQLDGQEAATLRAGDAFFEPRDARVLHFDNESGDEPLVFVACYLLGPGESELIVLEPA